MQDITCGLDRGCIRDILAVIEQPLLLGPIMRGTAAPLSA
jgi:hypothetical protein